MIRWVALAALAVAPLSTASAGTAPDFSALQAQPYEPPKAAPLFTLPDLEGRAVGLEALRGKLVLVFFWATWWPDCREELPPVNQLYSELRGKGLEVLLISFREDPELVQRTVRERGYVAPVLIDRSGEVAGRVYGVWGPPTAFFVDRGGRLVARVIGARDWSTPGARTFVEALLAAKPWGVRRLD